MDIRDLDLNLLVVFEALLAEGGVSRAASRLGRSQSAVSEALGRLRESFDDPLFIRTGRGMAPTRKAIDLAEPLGAALRTLRTALEAGAPFDPRTSCRSFVIGASDYAEAILLPPLLAKLGSAAPGVDLRIAASSPATVLGLLERGEIDFAVDVFPDALPPRFRRVRLMEETAVCLARRDHPALADGLSLETYLALPHVVRDHTGRGVIDRVLSAAGLHRRVGLSMTSLLALPAVLQWSDLVATQPSRIADLLARLGGLAIHPPPLQIPGWSVDLIAGRHTASDSAVAWLQQQLVEAAQDVAHSHSMVPGGLDVTS